MDANVPCLFFFLLSQPKNDPRSRNTYTLPFLALVIYARAKTIGSEDKKTHKRPLSSHYAISRRLLCTPSASALQERKLQSTQSSVPDSLCRLLPLVRLKRNVDEALSLRRFLSFKSIDRKCLDLSAARNSHSGAGTTPCSEMYSFVMVVIRVGPGRSSMCSKWLDWT